MTQRFSFTIRTFALLLFALPLTISAQRNTITGWIFGPEGRGIDKARVELLDDTYSVKQRRQSDKSGRFVFNNVGDGRYQVRVRVPGSKLREQTQDVELMSGRVETVRLDFRFKPRNEGAAIRAAATVFAQEVPDSAKKYFDAANAQFAKRQQAAGVQQLELAVKEFPTYFAALERLGVEQLILRRYDDAAKTFATAVAVNTRSFNALFGLAYANFALERSPEAIEAADKALAIDKNAADVYFILGMSHRRLGHYDLSEKAFLKAKTFDNGTTPEISWNLALLYAHNLRQYGKAADELELFLKVTPNNPDVEKIRKLITTFRSQQN